MQENLSNSLNIQLKLLEDNNVILAKCPGFATEIFMPAIIGNRLSIINVVPQRRCHCISTNFIVAKQEQSNKPADVVETPNQTISQWCLTADFNSVVEHSVLASTPEQIRNAAAFEQRPPIRRSLQFENVINSGVIASPEQAQNFQENNENVDITIESFPFDDRSSSSALDLPTPAGSLSAIEWPQTPPNEARNVPCLKQEHFGTKSSEMLPRWRKVITPIRTYARRKCTPNKLSTFLVNKIRPNFLMNPTEGLKGEKKFVPYKHKKLPKFDEKLRISPRTFKHQLECKTADELYTEIRQEHKNRDSEIKRKIAFELFTKHTFSKHVSCKLTQQFRERCTNKFSSTYPKYKKLAALDSTQQ